MLYEVITPAIGFLAQFGDYAARIREREGLVALMTQRATPGVEDHDGLCTCFDLRVQVVGHRARVQREQAMRKLGSYNFV